MCFVLTVCLLCAVLPTFLPLHQAMERQLIDDKSPFWDDHFPGMVRERQAGVFTHVLSVIFVRGAFLFGLAEASTHGRSIIDNNTEVPYRFLCFSSSH